MEYHLPLAYLSRDLAMVVSIELTSRAREFAGHRFQALSIDCQPRKGVLHLSLLTDSDSRGKWFQEEWTLYQFTRNNASAAWQRAEKLALEIQRQWELAMSSGTDEAQRMAKLVYLACAEALISTDVGAAMARHKLDFEFEFHVADPDDPEKQNYCEILEA